MQILNLLHLKVLEEGKTCVLRKAGMGGGGRRYASELELRFPDFQQESQVFNTFKLFKKKISLILLKIEHFNLFAPHS